MEENHNSSRKLYKTHTKASLVRHIPCRLINAVKTNRHLILFSWSHMALQNKQVRYSTTRNILGKFWPGTPILIDKYLQRCTVRSNTGNISMVLLLEVYILSPQPSQPISTAYIFSPL